MNKEKFYTVFIGHNCGVYETESEAKRQTHDYPDGFYETFDNYNEAIQALESFFISEPRNKK